MSRAIVQIGPADQGRHMSLEDFDQAEAVGGHLYELNKGVIVVVDVPDPRHLAQLDVVRDQLYLYRSNHAGRIYRIAGGGECKILLSTEESERHPDLAVYFSPPVINEGEQLWASWVPEIAIEIVSRGSRHRDYVEKREEYLKFGVREYWIIDDEKEEMLVHRRSGGRWIERVIGAEEIYGTRLLPGLEFHMKPIFDAAREAK